MCAGMNKSKYIPTRRNPAPHACNILQNFVYYYICLFHRTFTALNQEDSKDNNYANY